VLCHAARNMHEKLRPGGSSASWVSITLAVAPPGCDGHFSVRYLARSPVSKVEFGSVLSNEDEQIRRSSVLLAAADVADAEPAMCEKCKELDQEIERYRERCLSATDQPTIDRFRELIRGLYEQKIALHTTPA
jgi:hypothetical protein